MRKADLRRFRKTLREFERITSMSYEGACACSGISLAQCHLLLGIEELEDPSVTTLATALDLDRSTVSRTVDSLEAKGFVARRENPQDRRMASLLLTPEGEAAVHDIHRENDDYFRTVFGSIPRDRHAEVLGGLDLLVAAMRRR